MLNGIWTITETVFVEDPDHVAPVLGRLNRLGVRLALDHFGTGHLSLGHLLVAVLVLRDRTGERLS